MNSQRIHLLGIPVDAVTMAEALAQIRRFLASSGQHAVFTPNNEMLVEAEHNPAFRAVLQRSSLNIPDSTGLLLMVRLRGGRLPERVTGTDTMQRLCESLGPEHPVFLLGAAPGVAERAAEVLRRRNPELRIAGTYAGAPGESFAPAIIRAINDAAPHLLFVAFGAPAQELWIDHHLRELPSVRVAMGVGGAFDFIVGVHRRAPRWMQTTGLEWLWRLIRQPSRLPRIWNAVVVFPFLCVREMLSARKARNQNPEAK